MLLTELLLSHRIASIEQCYGFVDIAELHLQLTALEQDVGDARVFSKDLLSNRDGFQVVVISSTGRRRVIAFLLVDVIVDIANRFQCDSHEIAFAKLISTDRQGRCQ